MGSSEVKKVVADKNDTQLSKGLITLHNAKNYVSVARKLKDYVDSLRKEIKMRRLDAIEADALNDSLCSLIKTISKLKENTEALQESIDIIIPGAGLKFAHMEKYIRHLQDAEIDISFLKEKVEARQKELNDELDELMD